MSPILLDANVLIALTVPEHQHHDEATRWAEGVGQFAVCPIVEGALIRFLLRVGEGIGSATALLRAVRGMDRCEFWADSMSYADAALDRIRGHRQVTDAYLVALAVSRGGRLATFDVALARNWPDAVIVLSES